MNHKKKSYNITEADIMAGKYDPVALVEPLWWSVSIYDGLEQYEADLKPFTPAQRAVFAVLWLDSEVCNGGFDQFMYYSTGIVWKDALAGFELIGAEKLAAILRNVIEKCCGAIPFDRIERQELLARITADPENKDENTELADRLASALCGFFEKIGRSIPFDRPEQQELFDRLTSAPENEGENTDPFIEDDRAYYSANDELKDLIMEYVKANPAEFTFTGEVDVPENIM